MSRLIDLTGERFGLLVVLQRSSARQNRHVLWDCACDCGRSAICASVNLKTGHTKSCGCLRGKSQTHGHARREGKTATYRVWCAMHNRCNDPASIRFQEYGGRGIVVCQEWNEFQSFLGDMGERPSPRHSIDRINNDGNYEPANCRWATSVEQANNKRTTTMLTVNGKTMPVMEWVRELGFSPPRAAGTLIRQRARRGWGHERALSSIPSSQEGAPCRP